MPPSYMYPTMTREAADVIFTSNSAKDGTYIIRERPDFPNEYVMGVMFKGKPTHHLVKFDGSGAILVNNKAMGGAKSIQELIDYLSKPVTGWPVVLTGFIPNTNAGGAPATPSAAPAAADDGAAEAAKREEERKAKELQERQQRERQQREQERSREQERLKAEREKQDREAEDARRLDAETAERERRQQQQQDDEARRAEEEQNRRKQHEDEQRSNKQKQDAEARRRQEEEKKRQEEEKKRHEEERQRAEKEHEEAHRRELEKKVKGSPKNQANEKEQQWKADQERIHQQDIATAQKDLDRAIAERDEVASELEAARKVLRELQSKRNSGSAPDLEQQKQALAEYTSKVASLEGSVKAKKAEVNSLTAAKSSGAPVAVVTDPTNPPYHHGDITREVAEERLQGNNGCYLVRNRGPPGEMILALKFKDRPTHHLVKLGENGFMTVNGKQFGQCKTLHELVTFLTAPQPGWPIVLNPAVNDPSKSAQTADSSETEARIEKANKELSALVKDLGIARKKSEEAQSSLQNASASASTPSGDDSKIRAKEQLVADKETEFSRAEARVQSARDNLEEVRNRPLPTYSAEPTYSLATPSSPEPVYTLASSSSSDERPATYLDTDRSPGISIREKPKQAWASDDIETGPVPDKRRLSQAMDETFWNVVDEQGSSIIVIAGRNGFADFMNGYYDIEAGIIHDDHPVYRKTSPIPGGNGASSGRFLYLYYHLQHQAWAISQNLGSNGIIAYASSKASTPEGLKGVVWKVANRYQEFIDDDTVTCRLLTTGDSVKVIIFNPVPARASLSPFRHSVRKQRELNFFKVSLTMAEVQDLVAELCSPTCQIASLKLYANGFGPKILGKIVDALKVNRSITHLQIRENNIDDDMARSLGDVFHANPVLRLVSLRDNKIGNAGAKHIAEGLRNNAGLKGLSIRGNMIDDEGAEFFVDALRVNNTLGGLALYDNHIKNLKRIKSVIENESSCFVETKKP